MNSLSLHGFLLFITKHPKNPMAQNKSFLTALASSGQQEVAEHSWMVLFQVEVAKQLFFLLYICGLVDGSAP